MVERNQEEGRLTFTTDLGAAVRARARSSSSPSARRRARTARPTCSTCSPWPQAIGRNMNEPQGRRHQVHRAGGHRGEGARRGPAGDASCPFAVCSNPEFLKEGAAIDDFMKPDRVVIGVDTDEAQARDGASCTRRSSAGRQPDPVHGHRLGRDDQVRRQRDARHPDLVHEPDGRASASWSAPTSTTCARASARDQRIGHAFLFPGPGYGGSCFPKDVKALIRTADELGLSLDVLEGGGGRERARRSASCCSKALAHLGQGPERQDVGDLGPRLQGRDRRHAREPGHPAHRGAARGRRAGADARSQGHRVGAAPSSATASCTPPIPTAPRTAPTRCSS